MSTHNRVSVIMPAVNAEATIQASLDSALPITGRGCGKLSRACSGVTPLLSG